MLDWLIPTTPVGWVLLAASVVLILLPPRYDPAIRVKEWLEKKRGR